MDASIFQSVQPSLIAVSDTISQPSDLEIAGLISRSQGFGSGGETRWESGQDSVSASASNISQLSELEMSGLIPNARRFSSSGENVVVSSRDSDLTGTDNVDVFILNSAGANISGFEVGKDKVGIVSSDPVLTFLDIINPNLPGGITDTDKGAVISLPDGSTRSPFVTLSGVSASALANSPESWVHPTFATSINT